MENLEEYSIKITSPQNGTTYEIGDILSSNDVEVEKFKKITERYKLRKVVNGIETNPPEYQNNGKIYNGEVSTTSYVLNESAYELTLE